MNDFPHGFLLKELNIQLLVLSQHMHFFFASYIHNSYAKHTKIWWKLGGKSTYKSCDLSQCIKT